MKKRYNIILAVITLLCGSIGLTSCLKDSRYVDFGNAGTAVLFPLGGTTNFGADAVLQDTTYTVAVEVADSKSLPATTVTIAVDPSIVTSYVAANPSVKYQPLPSSAYSLPSTTVNVPAGQSYGTFKLTIKKSALDPTISYMLPIKIVSSSPSYTISSNFGIHYYHVIGNPFAGVYKHYYTRYNATDSVSSTATAYNQLVNATEVASPVTPTQFEIHSYYYTGPRYEVTFTQTGSGASAVYSNFAVSLNSDDNAAVSGTTVAFSAPSMPLLDPTKSYTYAEVLQRLRFVLPATVSGTSPRYTIDTYVHQ